MPSEVVKKIRPVSCLVPMPGMAVITPVKPDEKSQGGIFIPESVASRRGRGRYDEDYQPVRGKVLAVTPPDKGNTQLTVGDEVLYHPGNEVEWDDGTTVHIIAEGDVAAILKR